MLRITELQDAVRFEVKVQPRSSRNQIVGVQDEVLRIKLTAPPVEGEANQALVNFLASQFKVPKKNVNLVKGETSRIKLIEIKGINKEILLKTTGQN